MALPLIPLIFAGGGAIAGLGLIFRKPDETNIYTTKNMNTYTIRNSVHTFENVNTAGSIYTRDEFKPTITPTQTTDITASRPDTASGGIFDKVIIAGAVGLLGFLILSGGKK